MPTTRAAQVVLPLPRADQRAILDDPARHKVVVAGRRWGKSTCGIPAAVCGHGPGWPEAPTLRGSLRGGRVWWVVPDRPTTGRDRWRDLRRALRAVAWRSNEVEMRLDLPGGGSVEVRSADDPDSLRGTGLDGVVLDEAALMAERTWTEAIRPALAETGGWSLTLSTPRGRTNWLYPHFRAGAELDVATAAGCGDDHDPAELRPGWRSWHHRSSDNPLVTPTELADLRAQMGTARYVQEIDAQFATASGGLLSPTWMRWWDRAGEAAVLEGDTVRHVPLRSLATRATADLAVSVRTSADWTVVVTYGVTPAREVVVCDLDRFRAEGPDVVGRLEAGWRRWRWATLGVEAPALGLALVQSVRRAGLPVRAIHAKGDKVARAMHLGARMEAGGVYFPRHAPWLDTLTTELGTFPGGAHDDQVDALAYAAIDATENGPGGFESW